MHIDVIGRLIPASATAHEGTHAGQSIWERWNFDPELVIPVVLLTALYLRGLRTWRDRSREHPHWRTACYLLGMALLLASVESPLDAAAEHHFSMHMIQHEIIMMFVAPLILLGAPTTPVLRGIPRGVRRRVVRPIARRREAWLAYRLVTHPVLALGAFTAVIGLWHFAPGWYDAAIRDDFVHDVQHFSFMLIGVLIWWNVIDPKPLRSRLGYVGRMGFLVVASTPKSFLGAIIVFAEEPLYEFWFDVEPLLDLTPLEDQDLGGLLMWVPSQMMFLLALGLVFAVWARKSEERQRAEDEAILAARAEAGAGS